MIARREVEELSITIELTEGQEQILKALARGRNMTPEAYLEGIFAGEFPFPFKKPSKALEEWKRLGLLPQWQDRPEDSIELARKLRYQFPYKGEQE